MHGPTHAARAPGVFAQRLGEEVVKGSSLRQKVGVGAVSAENAITGGNMFCDADRGGLLTDNKMAGALDNTFAELVADFFFGTTDLDHLAQPAPKLIGGTAFDVDWAAKL
jgi:hypothetical protein